jgi:sugar/nucleoside kinase (ribokinase family)
VLLCNEVPLHVVREALICARAAGATTILNPAPATGIDRSVFALADIITPNRNELSMLLIPRPAVPDAGPMPARKPRPRARQLLDPGPEGPGVGKAVIVTLGAAGVLVLERTGAGLDRAVARPRDAGGFPAAAAPASGAEAASTPVAETTAPTGAAAGEAEGVRMWEVPGERVSTLDSTGAGDAFNGALAAAIAEGRPLVEAVHRAVSAGALATTHVGAREGMPTALELEEFLATR